MRQSEILGPQARLWPGSQVFAESQFQSWFALFNLLLFYSLAIMEGKKTPQQQQQQQPYVS